ncbi:MAG: methyltransferase domain-containing protein [Bacteroidetes bacterium]|nr:methyltransferase domain-containing protein [Bacteroidota bacterium]
MKCIVCSEPITKIHIAETPISGYRCATEDESLAQPSFELAFRFCNSCNMINYSMQEGADKLLDKLYSEHVSTYYYTKQLSEYMTNFVDGLSNQYNINSSSTVLEIGCNSGRLLTMFREKTGCSILGIEPSKTFSEEWSNENIEVINDYFSANLFPQIKNRKIDLVVIRHVYEHIPDPVAFFKDLSEICTNETTIIIEVPYFVTVLKRKRIENVSYSHLNYFTIRSISEIAKMYGFGVSKYELVETDGGAIVYHITKGVTTNPSILDSVSQSDIEEFVDYIETAKGKIQHLLSKYTKEEVVGYGAGSKGPHLVYILGLKDYINLVVDDTPGYAGMYLPGTSVQICSADVLKNKNVKAVVNLAPTHSEAIQAKTPANLEFIEVI